MSTPYGRRGHFFDEWQSTGTTWERIKIKATECPRISAVFLADERKSLGDYFYSQEYECEFRDVVDQIFASELVEKAVTSNVKPLF